MGIADFISGKGIKRKLASYLAIVLQLVLSVPGLESVAPVLEILIGALGGTALISAAKSKTLTKVRFATAASLLMAVAAVLQFIPTLSHYAPFLVKIASLLGAAEAGSAFQRKKIDEQLKDIEYVEFPNIAAVREHVNDKTES